MSMMHTDAYGFKHRCDCGKELKWGQMVSGRCYQCEMMRRLRRAIADGAREEEDRRRRQAESIKRLKRAIQHGDGP